MANLDKFPPKYPLFTFSDDPSWNPSRRIANPELVGRRPPWAINNLLWLRALQLASDAQLSYYLFIEPDSRVGCKDFDEILLDEFLTRYPNGIACAGSPICWNPSSGGKDFAMKIIEEAWKYQQAADLPMALYASKSPHDCSGAAYYPNGSCMIVQTEAMLKIFGGFAGDIINYSRNITAFDMHIGQCLWNYHGPAAAEHVGWLAKSFSGYGDCLTTQNQRQQMLTNGSKFIAHQFKDNWTP